MGRSEDRAHFATLRVSATEQRVDQLWRRQPPLVEDDVPTGYVRRARALARVAELHAAAEHLHAAHQYECSAVAHDYAARVHLAASRTAPNDLLWLGHLHIAEAHRSAAAHDRDRAEMKRRQARTLD